MYLLTDLVKPIIEDGILEVKKTELVASYDRCKWSQHALNNLDDSTTLQEFIDICKTNENYRTLLVNCIVVENFSQKFDPVALDTITDVCIESEKEASFLVGVFGREHLKQKYPRLDLSKIDQRFENVGSNKKKLQRVEE